MAEFISAESSRHKGRKIHSTSIDLTPMVDLGFILITFFLFTTSLMKPNSMVIQMPDNTPTKKPNVIPDHEAVKVFLGAHHHVYFLQGKEAMNNDFSQLDSVSSLNDYAVRQTFIRFKKDVAEAVSRGDKGTHPDDEPYIFIKPTSKADYSDLINILDELSVEGIHRYVIMELDEQEKKRFES